MDKLYKDLITCTGKENFESVHLADFPTFDRNLVNSSLEQKMNKAQTVSSLVLSLRQKEKIKVRQPLQRIMIPVLNETDKHDIEAVADLIKSEVNVKEIELLDDASGVLVKKIKPNFKALGPRFGKDMKAVAGQIQNFDQDQINTLEKEGVYTIDINGSKITLELSDVEITSQDIEGWLVANANGITVALDVTIDENLRKEGISRELVNRIQNLRKDQDFEVIDHIEIFFEKNDVIEEAVLSNDDYIKTETLTKNINFEERIDGGTDIEFDNIKTKILIRKLK